MRFLRHAVFILCLLLNGIDAGAVLYTDDAQTRRRSTPEETFLAVPFGSAVGILVAPNVILSARHLRAKPHLVQPGIWYFPQKILEMGGDSDYQLVEVKWGSGESGDSRNLDCPKELKIFKTFATGKEEVLHQDNLYAVGRPRDKKDGQYYTSFGDHYAFLKIEKILVEMIFFNAGAVIGNSGGPILNSKGELLGMVTGGPGMEFEPIFDRTNFDHFNWGLSIQGIYKNSEVFRKIIDGQSK